VRAQYYTIIFAVFLLISPGCENEGSNRNIKVKGIGPVANFYVTIGSPQSVVLKAQQNIMDVMSWEVANKSLKVKLDKDVSIQNYEEIRFEITVPEIDDINLVGIGDFELAGNNQDKLSITLTGVGHINAYDMQVNTCNITLTGVGDCKVYVLDQLNATITGVGSVYYKGNPDINSVITGVGKLVNAN
jgi:hypothetical protein